MDFKITMTNKSKYIRDNRKILADVIKEKQIVTLKKSNTLCV